MPPAVWPPPVRLHRPSGQGRFRWHGRDYYVGPYGSAEAAIRYAELLCEIGERGDVQPVPVMPDSGPSVAYVVAEWRRLERPRYDPEGHSPRQYDTALGVLLRCCRDLPAAEFGLARLRAVREAMVARKWARVTINRHVVRLQTVWRWAEERELVPRGAWAGLRVLKPIPRGDRRVPDHPPCRPLDQGEYELLLLGCHPLLAAMVEVQWLTAVRSGELRRMRAGEVVDATFRPLRHKNTWRGHDRAVPLGPRARAVLAPWLAGKAGDDFVFPTSRGSRRGRPPVYHGARCYTAEGYAQAFARAAHAVGLPDGLAPYGLRHGAKRRLEQAVGLDAARVVLGHSTPDTTARYAAERDLDAARRLAEEMG